MNLPAKSFSEHRKINSLFEEGTEQTSFWGTVHGYLMDQLPDDKQRDFLAYNLEKS